MRIWRLFLILVVAACDNNIGEQTFTIKGTLPDNRYDNTYIYIEKRDILSSYPALSTDSVLIKDGRFIISGVTGTMPTVYHMVIPAAVGPHHDLPIVVDKRVTHVIYDDTVAIIKGGEVAKRYNDLILSIRKEIENQKNRIVAERDIEEQKGALTNEQVALYNERIRKAYDTQIPNQTLFIRENIENPVGWYFFFSTSLNRYKKEDRTELYAMIPDTLRNRYEEREKVRSEKQTYFMQSQKQAVPGNQAREIIGFNVDGNSFKLSDHIGKVVLVDIWASWCAPCIQEFSELKELYSKHHKAGLEIIGFSLDKEAEAWEKAIKTQELPWINISDLDAWDSKVVADFGVQAIPFTILIDRKGVIVGRNLHAHNLRSALDKLFLEK